jgi:epoxyqueuosine reductase
LSEYHEIALAIKQKALDLGFSACGFSVAEPLNEFGPFWSDWIAAGNAGEMNYLTRNVEVRLNPEKLLEGAKTIISLAANYYFPLSQAQPDQIKISRYALSADYHLVLKSRGKELLRFINEEFGPVKGRVFTDSAPILEREWARRAGIGWIGKNGCLIIPRMGSWFFLVEIIVDLEVKANQTVDYSPDLMGNGALVPDRCGNCTRCIDACPTQALAGDGSMTPTKCISYLTIEHKSAIPVEFRGKWQNWVFGCDICQEVCPWNKDPESSLISELRPHLGINSLDKDFFKNLNKDSFLQQFDGTPVMRGEWTGLFRNFEFLEKDPSE